MRSAFVAVALGWAMAAWAGPAAAQCTTDIDCPGPACGDPVCQPSVGGNNCVPAGTDPTGFDGACSVDADCKCATQGATCNQATFHCTFTVPQDAGTEDAGSSTASGSGTESCALGAPGTAAGWPAGLACAAGVVVLAARRRRGRAPWTA